MSDRGRHGLRSGVVLVKVLGLVSAGVGMIGVDGSGTSRGVVVAMVSDSVGAGAGGDSAGPVAPGQKLCIANVTTRPTKPNVTTAATAVQTGERRGGFQAAGSDAGMFQRGARRPA